MPEERCRYRCPSRIVYASYVRSERYSEKDTERHYHRTEIENEALTKKDYSGLDFINIIQLYFADSFDPESSEPAGKHRSALNS